MVQDAQELNDSEKASSTCFKHLHGLIEWLKNTVTQMTGMKPKEAIQLNEVPLVENYATKDILPEDGLYWYFLQPGKNTMINVRE